MSNPNDYTVGWICALRKELVAAQEFLDEEHEGPEFVSTNDNNNYKLGRIRNHNVVIAVLPGGEYGLSSAASVAANMLNSFPNIRIGVLVGIGGGAPSPNHDIRLGDIVVSEPHDTSSGVFQYDFGRTMQGQTFQHTRFLNQPPTVLRTALENIQASYERTGHQIHTAITRILNNNRRLRQNYERPAPETDVLFKSDVIHDSRGCAAFCARDLSNIVPRRQRQPSEDNPAIHYGLIASANQVMRDAIVRDKLSAEREVLCFEMEAAGLMNHFPCLVVRGICDYSDSHKNKEWQGYAAMAAAGYTKDLLCCIPANRVETERSMNSIVFDIHQKLDEQLNDWRGRTNDVQSQEEAKCHQLFRLTATHKDITYEWYKDRIEDRVEDTCLWFLNHRHFVGWLRQESGPLLVLGDPGRGKSVLTKYLVDQGLPKGMTICYFFFNSQDQSTVRQALCALLHQLFIQKPSLLHHAVAQFKIDGDGMTHSTESLWKILRNTVNDREAGSIILVLDGLDECAESEMIDLVRNIISQFRHYRSGSEKFKYLLTCRPYEQIISRFRILLDIFPNTYVSAEEESDTISQEIRHFINYRIDQLAETKQLTPRLKEYLTQRLQSTTHRTYLWACLIFSYLEKENFKRTIKGIQDALAVYPQTVNEAYEKILDRSAEPLEVRKVLGIVLAACRPLTISEINIALNIDSSQQSIRDLDLEDNEHFESRLRNQCGLFITIQQGRVYLLHQTAREFLLANTKSETTSQESRWHHSITPQQAHAALAEICVLYLNLFNGEVHLETDASEEADNCVCKRSLLEYSAKNWAGHFREAGFSDKTSFAPLALEICDPNSNSYSEWFSIYWTTTTIETCIGFTNLMVASFLGLVAVVKLHLGKGYEIDLKDKTHGRTSLLWAASYWDNGFGGSPWYRRSDNHEATLASAAGYEDCHKAVIRLLVQNGANVMAKDNTFGRTALSWAADNGRAGAVEVLLQYGANVNAEDEMGPWVGQTPLFLAARYRHEAVVRILIKNGANIEHKDKQYQQTPLFVAAEKGHTAIVKLLIDQGADFEAVDHTGETPIGWAAEGGNPNVVQLLLDSGADAETEDWTGRTPLMWAERKGHQAIVQLLRTRKKDNDASAHRVRTPRSLASGGWSETGVKLLLMRNDVDINTRDYNLWSPLTWAAVEGHEALSKELLSRSKVDIDARDAEDRTPLSWAASRGDESMVRLLLNTAKVDINSKATLGRTPLSWAAGNGHEAVVSLLLRTVLIDVEERDNFGWTPFSWAAGNGHETVAKLLLSHKEVDVDSKDLCDRSPLSWAAARGHKAIAELLLSTGKVEIDARDTFGFTPLSWAAGNGHEAVVQLLLDTGNVDVNSRDNGGWLLLSWPVTSGYVTVVQLLLSTGKIDNDAKDISGRTAYSWVAQMGLSSTGELDESELGS